MKSFKQYISENWSHATKEDMSDENAHKYLFHTTSPESAEQIVKTGRLEPRPEKETKAALDFMKKEKDMFSDFADEDEFNPFDDHIEHYERKVNNTFVLRSGSNPESLRDKLSTYGVMSGKGTSVIKFPIANLSRKLARRMRVDYDGSRVGDIHSENPEAITVPGPIENKYKIKKNENL